MGVSVVGNACKWRQIPSPHSQWNIHMLHDKGEGSASLTKFIYDLPSLHVPRSNMDLWECAIRHTSSRTNTAYSNQPTAYLLYTERVESCWMFQLLLCSGTTTTTTTWLSYLHCWAKFSAPLSHYCQILKLRTFILCDTKVVLGWILFLFWTHKSCKFLTLFKNSDQRFLYNTSNLIRRVALGRPQKNKTTNCKNKFVVLIFGQRSSKANLCPVHA